MRPVDPRTPLFHSRLDAGEELYFRSPLGRPEPADTVLLVASDGGVEVAWPWAYLCALPVRRLVPGALPAHLDDLAGRVVAVVDDGLLAPDAVRAVLDLAARATPRRLVLVAPAVPGAVRRACRGSDLDGIVTLRPSTHADLVDRLYPQRPVQPGVARVLLAEVQQAMREDRDQVPDRDHTRPAADRADSPADGPPHLQLVAK